MRRSLLLLPVCLVAVALAGCGLKGPLVMPPAKPAGAAVPAPAPTPAGNELPPPTPAGAAMPSEPAAPASAGTATLPATQH